MRSIFLKSWRILAGLSIGLLLLAGPASADWEWLYTHGHSGHIQDESAVSGLTPTGGALRLTLSGLNTFVHFAVPSKPLSYNTSTATGTQWKVRQLHLKFQTGSADARITRIEVWDGNIQFKVIDYGWDSGLYGGQDINIDLGKSWRIYRALGVTLKMERGVEQGTPGMHDFYFYAVGAKWQQ